MDYFEKSTVTIQVVDCTLDGIEIRIHEKVHGGIRIGVTCPNGIHMTTDSTVLAEFQCLLTLLGVVGDISSAPAILGGHFDVVLLEGRKDASELHARYLNGPLEKSRADQRTGFKEPANLLLNLPRLVTS